MKRTDIWESPFTGRYPSEEMKRLFSADTKFSTWRKLWVALAKAEQQLGLDITNEQIEEMEAHINDINYEVANMREKEVRHDVMAHVYAYGVQCPKAKGIIHLGATSCFVTDNTDILNLYSGLEIVKKRLLGVIKLLADFALEHSDIPTLGYTHGQPASPVTVGKRAALWLQNFMEDLKMLEFVKGELKMLGCRGATGTQETFMQLFDGDQIKVRDVDVLVAKQFGDFSVYPVSGQTYPRHTDIQVLSLLASIASSAYKMAGDIRLLQSFKEIEEPFEKKQIGSSAMAYKRNPMRSERICSLARGVQSELSTAFNTASTQWLERTLDDSAVRRTSIPEAFLGVDAVLILCANVTDGMVVYPKVIEKRLADELPFMATEPILMEAVKKGGNRQELHEKIRVYSMEAGRRIKELGQENNLVELISNDPAFGMTKAEIMNVLDPKKLTGRCKEQVEEYILGKVIPVLEANSNYLSGEINKEVTV